jgi:hypothetical protein
MCACRPGRYGTARQALCVLAVAIAGLALWAGSARLAEACHPVRLDSLSAYGGAADHGCGGTVLRLPVLPAPPSEPEQPADPGALPPVVALAIQDLAVRTSLPALSIAVAELQAVEWPDSSLGCPQPGVLYLQVITPGYRIVLAAGGQRYTYHTDQGTRVVLCAMEAGEPQTEPAASGAAPGESEPTSLPAPEAEEVE